MVKWNSDQLNTFGSLFSQISTDLEKKWSYKIHIFMYQTKFLPISIMYEWRELEKFLGNKIVIRRYFWTGCHLKNVPKFRYVSNVYVFCNQQRFSPLSYLEGSLRCNSSSIMKMQFSFINGEVCLAHIWVKRSQWVKLFLKEYLIFLNILVQYSWMFLGRKKQITNFHKFFNN